MRIVDFAQKPHDRPLGVRRTGYTSWTFSWLVATRASAWQLCSKLMPKFSRRWPVTSTNRPQGFWTLKFFSNCSCMNAGVKIFSPDLGRRINHRIAGDVDVDVDLTEI
ncbi:hypothetical protein IWX85_002752 [Polaromonas sp. CG_9.11]|nr:hypothetical protein [Polaromonas sp. CG_9.11]MBG6076915.1 hypothetical protein [Polaromonas sp. CG_9.11]